MNAKMNASYSSKKGPKATQESRYSVEYTMDVAVKAGQESMPARLAKVLELLNSSLDVCDPEGTLEVNATTLKLVNGKALLIATYKNSKGLFEPNSIKVDGVQGSVSGDSVRFELDAAKEYTVSAGTKATKVKVVTEQKPIAE